MKVLFFLFFSATVSLMAAGCFPTSCRPESRVEFEADWLYFGRNHRQNTIFAVDAEDNAVLGSRGITGEMGQTSGLSARARFFFNTKDTLELRYVGLLNWSGEKIESGGLYSINLDKDFIGYENVSTVQGQMKTSLTFGEASYVGELSPPGCHYFWLSYQLGLRYANITEKLELNFSSTEGTSTYNNRAGNQLFGGQGGFRFEARGVPWFGWGFFLSGALYANFIKQTTLQMEDNNHIQSQNFREKEVRFACGLDAMPYFILRSRHFSLRAGYQVFFFNQLALAPQQFRYPADQINNKGNIIFKGLLLGVQSNF